MALTIKNKGGIPPSQFDKHLVSTPAKAKVSITKNGSTIKESEETVHAGVVLEKPDLCMVTVGGGGTVNLGEYNSAKVHVSLSMPTTKEDLEDTFQFVSDWVSKKIDDAMKEVKG